MYNDKMGLEKLSTSTQLHTLTIAELFATHPYSCWTVQALIVPRTSYKSITAYRTAIQVLINKRACPGFSFWRALKNWRGQNSLRNKTEEKMAKQNYTKFLSSCVSETRYDYVHLIMHTLADFNAVFSFRPF